MPDLMPLPPRPVASPLPVPSSIAEAGRHRLSPARLRVGVRVLLAERRPDWLHGARLVPSRRAIGGLIIVAAVLAGVLGLRVAMASAAARPVPVPSAAAGPGSSAVSAGEGPAATTPSAAAFGRPSGAPSATARVTATARATATETAIAATVVVQVAGRVHRPGVRRLPAGSRVVDAVRSAGGALPRSDLTSINLAAVVSDGEQVLVARAGHGSSTTSASMSGAVGGGAGSSTSGGPVGGGSGVAGAPVDLNTADLAALDTLPGVGPVLAQRILDWRTAHGRFSSVDELQEVSGIGDKVLAQIRPHAAL